MKLFSKILMLKFKILILLFCFHVNINSIFAQKNIAVIKLDKLFDKVLKSNDTIYIVNFWATWCGPCVKEIPDFEKLNSVYNTKKVKMLLVSIDFKKEINKVNAFVEKNKLNAEVVLLDEPRYNEWLDKIDPFWEGQIPVTVLYKNKQKLKFISNQTNFDNLESVLKSIL
jgi:thiol-disulfide isomerase/thioredoxin